jgi:hypothetical protein
MGAAVAYSLNSLELFIVYDEIRFFSLVKSSPDQRPSRVYVLRQRRT